MTQDALSRASDYPIVLYLNQRLTFDLLAALEDGFSHFATIQSSSTATDVGEGTAEVGLGISNPFALLGITFKGKGGIKKRNEGVQADSETREVDYTPASLFARLRQELQELDLVKALGEGSDFGLLRPGDFIEIEAVLSRSPLVDILRTFREWIDLFASFSDLPQSTSRPRGHVRGAQHGNQMHTTGNREVQVIKSQIQAMLDGVTASGSLDLIATTSLGRFVLAAEDGYFIDPSMNDVIDGTFRVFGKVTRVIDGDSEETISLLRKTTLGRSSQIVTQLVESLNSMADSPFDMAEIQTEISGPTLQIIPVAIFV